MAPEPAIALRIGLIALGQVPRPAGVVGIAFVVAAGIRVQRAGAGAPARAHQVATS
jgi:inner membrane transporter RhtA